MAKWFHQFFNKRAMQAGEDLSAPTIMVNIGFDDPRRGDCQALPAIAKNLQEDQQGRYVYLHGPMLKSLYPDLEAQEAVERYCTDYEIMPDIYLTTPEANSARPPKKWLKNNNIFFVDENNENLSDPIRTGLVAHHITPERLAAEQPKFIKAYPETTNRHLIGLNFIDASMNKNKFWEKAPCLATQLIEVARHHQPATIFICGTRRTKAQEIQKLNDKLQAAIATDDLDISIISFDLTAQAEGQKFYNPYLGLIATADTLVAPSNSLSILSECTAAGKQVLIGSDGLQDYVVGKFVRQGYGAFLSKIDRSKPFIAKPIKTEDASKQAAKDLWRQYKQFRSTRPRPQGVLKKPSSSTLAV